MNFLSRLGQLGLLAGLWLPSLAFASGLSGNPAPAVSVERWAASFAAFDAADKARTPVPDGVLFVGSSSIRLWSDLPEDFSSLPVVYQRGFGGSRMLDCAEHLKRLVVPYRPSLVLVYAGDNDLAEGRSPDDVLTSFRSFLQGVREALPFTRIAYISIKPSPSRVGLIPAIQETNAKIQAYVAGVENADYIDIFTPMLDESGSPRGELFLADALHMNRTGYALWKRVISEHVPASTSAVQTARGSDGLNSAALRLDAAAASIASTTFATP